MSRFLYTHRALRHATHALKCCVTPQHKRYVNGSQQLFVRYDNSKGEVSTKHTVYRMFSRSCKNIVINTATTSKSTTFCKLSAAGQMHASGILDANYRVTISFDCKRGIATFLPSFIQLNYAWNTSLQTWHFTQHQGYPCNNTRCLNHIKTTEINEVHYK